MATTTVNSFLATLRRSNLLTHEQMAAANSIAADSDAVGTARNLVKRTWLTEWQARQLLAGKSKLFLGKYKLLGVLGQGGMGAVLKAESTTLGRVVALKVLSKNVSNNEVAEARFLREIRFAGRLNHPNIVRALDADRVGERAFLVMEYVDGSDLKQVLKRDGQLSIEFACECIRQAAAGLQHAHEAGMIHRDVKPSNLLLTRHAETGQPIVKLLDLGLARLEHKQTSDCSITRTGQIMGSPDYMAPEQAMNARNADIRSDIYGLGVTLYQLLSNSLPFGGNNVMERLVVRINQDAPPISAVRPDVPAVLVHIIARMLHRDPSQRFQTPDEVGAMLQSFVTNSRQLLEQHTVSAPAPTESTIEAEADDTLNLFVGHLGTQARTQPARRRRKKKTSWVGVISVATAIAIVCGVLYALSKGSGPVSRQPPRLTGGVTPDTQPSPEMEFVPDGGQTPDRGGSRMSFPAFPSSFTNPDIKVAHWAIATASRVEIQIGEETSQLTSVDDIPEDDFSVTGLDLSGLQSVTDEVLDQVTSATQLRSLNLSGGAVSDEHLDRLSRLQHIQSLDLSNTQVTDAGLTHVVKMLQLTHLKLRYTEISTDGMQSLAALSALANLDLEGTNVTDSILESIFKPASLRELNLKHTRVTSVGADRIREKLPNCRVLF
jgi:serine/threonine protein kinase